MVHPCRIGVARDPLHWHEGFLRGLEAKRPEWNDFTAELIDIDGNDWLEVVRPFDVILWKSVFMGPGAAAQFRAKVHFMETVLGKLVVPNVATSWHFENKAAQNFIFRHFNVPTPATSIAYDAHTAEACLAEARLPVVIKQPHGAGSDNVFLARTRDDAHRAIQRRFARLTWIEMKKAGVPLTRAAWRALREGWAFALIRSRLNRESAFETMYWQEYVPNNASDLRVTVIGDDTVFAFRRGNRPGDFRASGSGRLLYDDPAPIEVLEYCLKLSRSLGFDSMSYDILFDEAGRFVISEMCYAYNDKAIYDTPGHFRRLAGGELVYREGHQWPQDLWGQWTAVRARRLWEARAAVESRPDQATWSAI